jgi:WD40 repeat protein/serine/threonine protein kinase
MSPEHGRAKALFLAALGQSTPAERARFLDRECAGEPALRGRVERLLQAHGETDHLLDQPLVGESETAGQAGTDPPGPEPDDRLSFLTPTDAPGVLGRLDHYDVLGVIGSGGMGVVLKARDVKLQRVVAVKVLAPAVAASNTARVRFVREARAAAAIRDEHVVDIHAVEGTGPVPYLVMEFVSGITLDERIRNGGTFDPKEVLRIGLQAAKGLAAAHAQGLIHRDVKPANILLENGVQRVKITDFGLARATDDVSVTGSGMIAGTPLYMSPEQARGERLDSRSDLFSLGSVLYTLCAGRPAFRAGSTVAVLRRVCEDDPRPLHEVNPDVPHWLTVIITKLLAKDPAHRFQSAAEVAEHFGQWLAYLQNPNGSAPVLPRVPRRWARWRWAVAGVLLLGAGAAGFFALAPKPAAQPSDSPRSELPPIAPAPGPKPEPWKPRPRRTPEELAKLRSPFDDRKRSDIPANLLAQAGMGNPDNAPAELVAVFTDARFRIPNSGPTSWPTTDREGKCVAVPCGNNVALYDAATGALRRVLTGHTGRVYSVAFSPDGKHLAAGNWNTDNTVRMWEVESGKLLDFTFRGHTRGIDCLAFNPAGTRLATCGADGTVRVWDAQTGEFQFQTAGEPAHAYTVAYSPKGEWIASSRGDGHLWVWDAGSGATVQKLPAHTPTGDTWDKLAFSVAFSPDGSRVASGSGTEVKIWDTTTWGDPRVVSTPGSWLAFTPDGRTLLTAPVWIEADQSHVVARWDVATGKSAGAFTLQSRGKAPAYHHLASDGKTLYSMQVEPAEPLLHTYDPEAGTERFPAQGHLGAVWAVGFSPDGKSLVSSAVDGTVQTWDLASWRPGEAMPPARVIGRHTAEAWDVCFSPDGTRVASGSRDGTVAVWEVSTGQRVHLLQGHKTYASTLQFSPDGRTLAVGRTDGTVRLWDAVTGSALKPIQAHKGHTIAVTYSPDGELLMSAGFRNGMINLFDPMTHRQVDFFQVSAPEIGCVAFGPTSRTLAVGHSEGISIWNLDTRQHTPLRGHTGLVESIAFHPAGTLLASASDDGTLRVWDLTKPECVRVFGPGPFGRMPRRVAFSPEGRFLATANFSGTITVLRTPE